MWQWAVFVLALSCTADQVPANSSVKFTSRDFRHELHWTSVDDPVAEPVHYSVQHKIYGEEWKDKRECQNITALSCDLTAEMSDIRNYYYARVMANGVTLGRSPRFQPLKGTVLGPPVVTMNPGERSLNLGVRLPRVADSGKSFVDLVFPDPVIYKANLFYQNKTHKVVIAEKITNLSEILFDRLQENTEYQVSVCYVLPVSKYSEAFRSTVKTLAVSDRKELLAIPAALAVLILLTCFLVFCQMFVRRKPLMPDSLFFNGQNLPESGNPKAVIHFPVETIATPEVFARVTDLRVDRKPRPAPTPAGDSYTPQGCDSDEQSWHCHSYIGQQGEPDLQSGSMQSSTNYSLVFVPHPDASGGPAPSGSTPYTGQLFPGACRLAPPNRLEPIRDEDEAEMLVLPVFRRIDNKLEVSSLFSFLQGGVELEGRGPGLVPTDQGSSGTEVVAEVGGTSYLPNLTPPTPYVGQPLGMSEPVPDWYLPTDGHAPSGADWNVPSDGHAPSGADWTVPSDGHTPSGTDWNVPSDGNAPSGADWNVPSDGHAPSGADWNVPSDGPAPSGYRGNGQEDEALLPLPTQDTGPRVGGAPGGVRGYFAQMFSESWGLWVQE